VRREPPLAAGAGLAFQPIDEVDDRVEASARAVADAGSGDGIGEMARLSFLV
jgi:hypothetical protein